MSVLIAVPVKRFYVAKRRLAPVLDTGARSRLGRHLAAHTLATIAEAGAAPLVLAADEEVAEWAKAEGMQARVDQGDGLDEAAAGAASQAANEGRPWMIVHADLPLLTVSDIETAVDLLGQGRSVIGPSNDGGTSLIGARRPIRFSYGPASFHRHLPRLPSAAVLVRLGIALDLDDSSDLLTAAAHPAGSWLPVP